MFSEPLVAAKAGGDPKSLMVGELGYDPYSSVLVAKAGVCDEQPELVEKFVRATRAGWAAYLADPQSANQAINEANPDMDLESLNAAAKVIGPLCGSEGTLGSMTGERWEALAAQMIAIKAIKGDAAAVAKAAWRAIE